MCSLRWRCQFLLILIAFGQDGSNFFQTKGVEPGEKFSNSPSPSPLLGDSRWSVLRAHDKKMFKMATCYIV